MYNSFTQNWRTWILLIRLTLIFTCLAPLKYEGYIIPPLTRLITPVNCHTSMSLLAFSKLANNLLCCFCPKKGIYSNYISNNVILMLVVTSNQQRGGDSYFSTLYEFKLSLLNSRVPFLDNDLHFKSWMLPYIVLWSFWFNVSANYHLVAQTIHQNCALGVAN